MPCVAGMHDRNSEDPGRPAARFCSKGVVRYGWLAYWQVWGGFLRHRLRNPKVPLESLLADIFLFGP